MPFGTKKLSISKISMFIPWALFVIPFAVYFYIVFRYSLNIPIADDYDAALDFLNKFIQVQTLTEKITLLFSQHNEHRIVSTRIAFLIQYYLFQEINFKLSIVVGNIGWIFTVLTLVAYFQRSFNLSIDYLLPIPYLLLSFTHWEIMLTSVALPNYWVLFMSILFLICLTSNRLFFVCMLFPITLFTFGSGVVLYPLGNLFFVIQKKWKSLVIFFVISTICMLIYFFGYHKPTYHPSIIEALINPLRTIAYFFAFLGNITQLKSLAISIGFIACLLSAYFVVKRRDDWFLHLVIGFVVINGLVAALTRSGFGVNQALSSRYSTYSLLAWVCIYIFTITSFAKINFAHKVVSVAIIGTVLFWGRIAVVYELNHFLTNKRNERVNSFLGFRKENKNSLGQGDQDRGAKILISAEQLHIYKYKNYTP